LEKKVKVNPGDGAFYGPKIDIHVFDALQREHQCATIQLDFILPERFDLSYISEDNTEEKPVMIHRAILGSTERFLAILLENTAHHWPFWLSPRPCIVLSIVPAIADYAKSVHDKIFQAGFDVDLDISDHTIKKKILEAQQQGYNYILVVGQAEAENNTVNVRYHNEQKERTLEDLFSEWQGLLASHK